MSNQLSLEDEEEEQTLSSESTKSLTAEEKRKLAFEHDNWEDLKACHGWKIYKKYPYFIRREHTCDYLLYVMKKGYLAVEINNRKYLLHRLIAEQWIPNPENLPFVDHIDGNKYNFDISNLRWVMLRENNANIHVNKKKKFDLDNDIPDTCKPLDIYNNKRIDNIYIDLEEPHDVYKFNGILFRKLNKETTRRGEFFTYSPFKSSNPKLPKKTTIRIYMNEAIDSIINTVPRIINQTTTQSFNIEYLTSLPLSSIPIKEYNGIKLKRFYWFDPSCNRIIRYNNFKSINEKYSEDEYKYRYTRSNTIALYYYNGNKIQIKTNELIEYVNPSVKAISEPSIKTFNDEVADFLSD